MSLQEFKDSFSKRIYGMTSKEAQKQGICIQCHEKASSRCYSDAGKREYKISGLCEKCFDEIMRG